MEKIIKKHNEKVLRCRPTPNIHMCNCRRRDGCLLNDKCLTGNVVYQAEVKLEVRPTMT